MKPRALVLGLSIACSARTPGETAASAPAVAPAAEAPPAEAPPAEVTPTPEPEAPVTPEPDPEPPATKVVAIEPWGLEITLPDSAGHVYDPGNRWFHAELGWHESAYLVKIPRPAPRTLAEIPKHWRSGADMRVLAEELLPDGSLFAAYLFEVMKPSDGKAMISDVTRIHVTRPLDARSHVECRVNIEHEASATALAESREMCMSLRPRGR